MTPAVRVAAPAPGRRVLALLLAGLLVLVYGAAAMPPPDAPWHGPDTHSSLPHRASGLSASFAVARAANEAVAVSLTVEGGGLLAIAPSHRPGTLAPEPPEHPPQA